MLQASKSPWHSGELAIQRPGPRHAAQLERVVGVEREVEHARPGLRGVRHRGHEALQPRLLQVVGRVGEIDRVHRLRGKSLERGVDAIIEMDLAANAKLYPAVVRPRGHIVVYGTGSAEATIPAQHVSVREAKLVAEVERLRRGTLVKQRLLEMIKQGKADAAEKAWRDYLRLFNQLTAEFLSDTHLEYYRAGDRRVSARNKAKAVSVKP